MNGERGRFRGGRHHWDPVSAEYLKCRWCGDFRRPNSEDPTAVCPVEPRIVVTMTTTTATLIRQAIAEAMRWSPHLFDDDATGRLTDIENRIAESVDDRLNVRR